MEKLFRILMDEADGQPGGGDAPVPEAAPAPEAPPELTPEQQELATLKEENARLKAQPAPAPVAAPAPANKPITSADMEGYTDEQWATIEAKSGRDKATILRDFKDWELTQRQNAIDAKTNTTEAIQEAIETNPKLLKLRGSIKEFLDEVPAIDKLDPAKMKRHMERAINYAKGKHMSTIPDTPANPNKPGKPAGTPSPKGEVEEDGETVDALAGDVKDDQYVNNSGLRIQTGRVDKKTWDKIKHKEIPNSVSIPADFDKAPSFNK